MISVVLAVFGSALAVFFPWRRLRRLGALTPRSERVLGALAEPQDGAVLRTLLARLRPEEPLAELLRSIVDAPSRAAARGALNEQLSTLDGELSRGAGATPAAVRLSLMVGALTAVAELIRGMGARAGAALSALTVGLLGAAVAREIGRRADHRAREIRGEYDALVRALARWL